MKVLKYSRQRETIKASLMNRTDHPTADALYADIRTNCPNISLATVYRNLNLLVDTGEIKRIRFGDGCDRFDANTRPHSHFICRSCGNIYDMEAVQLQEFTTQAQPFAPGRIEESELIFFGRCNHCLKA